MFHGRLYVQTQKPHSVKHRSAALEGNVDGTIGVSMCQQMNAEPFQRKEDGIIHISKNLHAHKL